MIAYRRIRGLRHFADAPIKLKLLILVFVVLVFPFSLAIQLIGSNAAAIDSFRKDIDVYAAINRLRTANADNLNLLRIFIDTGSMEDLNGYNQGIDRLVAAYKELSREGGDIELALLLHSIWNSFDSWYEEAHMAIRQRITGSGESYSSFYRAERIGRYLDGYISQLLDRSLVVGTETYRLRVEQARLTRTIAIAILFAFAGFCVGFALFFAGFITRPLHSLAAAAGKMSAGELEVGALRVESADEVGALTASFNSMNAHIVALVRDLKEKAALERRLHREELRNSTNQKMRKEAEFLALQARINPHFLFNTLNTISRDVMLRGGKDTVALVDALSALLRYGLEQGSGIVSLATELEIVRKYAFIQHYRFDNRVSIEIDCRLEDPDSVRLPAFSIQPLVENAFIHGLEPKLDGGVIRVEAFKRGAAAHIRVSDNGIGLDAARLKAIRHSREKESWGHTSSIGLSNVHDRLKLFTGEKECFSIRNVDSGGTLAEIIVSGAER